MPINVVPYVSAVGVSIPSRTGTPHAALSVSALSNRIMDGERYEAISRLLHTEANAIATALHASMSR